jgi:hypothetical protein
MPGDAPPPSIQAPRLLHGALLGGALIAAGALAVLRQVAPPSGGASVATLRYVALGIGAGILVVFRVVRARITPPALAGDDTAWWRANLGVALVSWTLAESLSLLGGGFYYLTGDPVALGVAAVGLALLLVARPSRLTEE